MKHSIDILEKPQLYITMDKEINYSLQYIESNHLTLLG